MPPTNTPATLHKMPYCTTAVVIIKAPHYCIYKSKKTKKTKKKKKQESQYTFASAVICIHTMHLTAIFKFLSVPLTYYLFGRHIAFSLFMPINFNIIHT